MLRCSFISDGHVYDNTVTQNIVRTINNILPYDNNFEFYYFLQNEFELRCFDAVKLIQKQNNDKVINMIKVRLFNDNSDSAVFRDSYVKQLSSIENYNTSIIPPVSECHKNPLTEIDSTMQWILDKTDCLISYIYVDLLEYNSPYLSKIKQIKREKTTIIDVTDINTKNKILTKMMTLPEELRYVYLQININKTPIAVVARELGVSPNKIRSIYYHACAKLRNMMYKDRIYSSYP